MTEIKRENVILNKSYRFALKIVGYTEGLQALKKFNLSNQLFRSGTAIGALVREAQSPESLADFVHKLKIASKETEETEYWLLLCKESENYPDPEELIDEVKELHRLLNAIISTSKIKLRSTKKSL